MPLQGTPDLWAVTWWLWCGHLGFRKMRSNAGRKKGVRQLLICTASCQVKTWLSESCSWTLGALTWRRVKDACVSVVCMLTQSCLTLCDPWDYSPPGSSVHAILQARVLGWVAMPSTRGSFWPRDWTHVSCISCTAGGFFTTEPLGKPLSVVWQP